MLFREALYRSALRALRLVAPLAARGDSKLARGVRGRNDATAALVRWGAEERDPDRDVIWFHAPSVGEGFQALAVARAVLDLRPDAQVVYTYFSPSAEAFAHRFPADFRGFLPWDLPASLVPVLDAVAPSAVAFTKTEVWPVLSGLAERRGIPMFLVGGSLPADAGRLSPTGRWLLGPAFRRLRHVGAIGPGDAERFQRLGVKASSVSVTGDPGIDSAAERAATANPEAPHLEVLRSASRFTVVAGSTWPPDEDVLVPALSKLRGGRGELRLVVAPHEPTPEHVRSLRERLAANGWRVATLGEMEMEAGPTATAESAEAAFPGAVDAVVVDRVGVLAELYSIGTVAYVGGGFHDEGLHSVLEPAAVGLPTLIGPKHTSSGAAMELLAEGGAKPVSSAVELERAVRTWMDHAAGRKESGERALGYIERHRGAARRSAELIVDVLEMVPR